MTSSYDPNRDILAVFPAYLRGLLPARSAQPVTLDSELAAYGRLWVCNSHATATETISIVLASNTDDDTTAVSIHIPPLSAGELPVIARRVLSAGTGPDVTVVLLA